MQFVIDIDEHFQSIASSAAFPKVGSAEP